MVHCQEPQGATVSPGQFVTASSNLYRASGTAGLGGNDHNDNPVTFSLKPNQVGFVVAVTTGREQDEALVLHAGKMAWFMCENLQDAQ